MRKLKYHIASTADGFIAREDRSFDCFPMEGDLCGGAVLASELFKEGLIDEVILKLNPLLLGPGISLILDIGRRVDLELIGSKVYDSSVVLLSYRVKV